MVPAGTLRCSSRPMQEPPYSGGSADAAAGEAVDRAASEHQHVVKKVLKLTDEEILNLYHFAQTEALWGTILPFQAFAFNTISFGYFTLARDLGSFEGWLGVVQSSRSAKSDEMFVGFVQLMLEGSGPKVLQLL
eukprot:s333_g9.t1